MERKRIRINFSGRRFAYASMALVVLGWGYDYVAAKAALVFIAPLSLICVKYAISFVMLLLIKCAIDRHFPFSLRDLPLLIVCALSGELLYYACEYGAMSYLPVSVIGIMLAFVPAVSVIIEYFLYKRRANTRIVVGIAASVVGVALVIGGNLSAFLAGGGIGYLLVFGAVFCWNIYNFAAAGLTGKYKVLDLTLYQMACTALLALPFLLHALPPASVFAPPLLYYLLYLSLVSAGGGFFLYVNALARLGPTPVALFSNMLPVATIFFGWLLLGEHIAPLQFLGGAIVILAGIVVIWEKDKLDTARQGNAD